MIGVYDFTGDIRPELNYLNSVYEESRNIIGVTDSFQGRQDTTAVSGRAKEFAAAQSAGRLESKRVMKDTAYSSLFELIFKFCLAYADEPRTVVHKDVRGHNEYMEFRRHDFLAEDSEGELYWNDDYLFSCDATAPLANNREAMWQETRNNLQMGAFGDPGSYETLILYWTKMEQLHYPGAGHTKQHLEAQLEAQREAARMHQGGALAGTEPGGPMAQPPPPVPGGLPPPIAGTGGMSHLGPHMMNAIARLGEQNAALRDTRL
jgi:hypothetical protein